MKKYFLLLSLLVINLKGIGQQKLDYSRTWVFMVGVLEWADANTFASFDKKGRLDTKILNFFQKQGVPASQMLYLKDQKATTKAVREAFAPFLKQAKKGDALFFYYCGHGYKNDGGKVCFANYQGADWTAEEIVKTVNENFAGNTAIFTADCCNSGGLAKEVQMYPSRNYAALNSVVPTDVSTGNWTFSNALLYGLEGRNFVDIDNNGQIQLPELAQYIDTEMAIVEGQKSLYFVPNTMKNFEIKAGVPIKKNSRIGERVQVDYDGTDWLGFIENVEADKRLKVRFYSYTNNEVDVVEASRVKAFKCTKDFPIGARVKVYSTNDKAWYAAKVLKKFSCLHYIHYEGYDDEYDEWVSTDKIKK
ncbi:MULTISPECIES: caspase family protein [Emticicia]|uniref:caspase family protein n=1 Tax=Emticicia TaxID=312278 RepID=UPI0007D8A158|nr:MULTISPECIES: caspase family protein [Emticicia]